MNTARSSMAVSAGSSEHQWVPRDKANGTSKGMTAVSRACAAERKGLCLSLARVPRAQIFVRIGRTRLPVMAYEEGNLEP